MSAEYSVLHPHEPEVAPVIDGEGRCLVCALIVREEQAGALLERRDDLAHWTRRMLQALDMYWMHYDGLDPTKRDPVTGAWVRHNIRSESTGEDWWNRFEKYRARVEALLG